MINLKKIQAMKRIKEEFFELNTKFNPNIGLIVGLNDEDNIFKWSASMIGPKDSSYKDGIFKIDVEFPDDYPTHPPEVVFRTPIYHLNINPYKSNNSKEEPLGHVSVSILNWWKSEYKMEEVFINIFCLLYFSNPESPYGLDRANEFRTNRQLYEDKIKYFINKYANPFHADILQKYDDSWDFTYK